MLTVHNLNRSFGSAHVLKDVGFSIRPGLMTGFVGGNGAGKTTTMRIILGVLSADSGTVEVDGAPITADYRAGIGYMPEERGLYPKMKIIDQLIYLAQLHGMDAPTAKARGVDILERLGLGERMKDNLETLSLGNQQRAQIAAALVHDPVALILDEPFSGLDPIAVDTTIEVLRDVAATGAPVLFSSHQLDLVERLCDELVIIANGEIRAHGTRESILNAATIPEWELHTNSDTGWIRGMNVQVTEFDGGYARFSAESPEKAETVLREALNRGTVTKFSPVTRSLHEIFQEVVR
ncbi:ABC transporter ATP-binding protein [Devriesea agamarum]|uniref:ABC transporter ATP-binding protein n=1 Tax=Devriesea agamarum TaxID=472569 RepID=UPI00071D87D5|nr:ATP-binding cassette domain-containing protein [Devriesea agamarum]